MKSATATFTELGAKAAVSSGYYSELNFDVGEAGAAPTTAPATSINPQHRIHAQQSVKDPGEGWCL